MKNQNTDPIDEIAGGYRGAQILFTACRMGIFEVIGKQSISLEELHQRLQADARGLRILCDALAALGLLEKENGRYRNSATALEYLLPDSPKSKTAILRHDALLYEKWGKLIDAVTQGQKVSDEAIDQRLLETERDFANAMADIAKMSAKQTADMVDLKSSKHLLDVGGGPGYFAIEFAKRNPELTTVILDDEKTLEVARENAEKEGVLERMEFRPGNMHCDDLGRDYDFIFISNVIHMFHEKQNAELIQKCADTMVPGGRIALKDFFLEPNRTQPMFSALFAVNMLVATETGDCYTVEQVKQWLHDAGLEYQQTEDITAQSKLIMGRKV